VWSFRRLVNDISDETKQFEKDALAFLKSINLTVVGYYPYDHCSDIIGYLPPRPPFNVSTKVMVEVLKIKPTTSIIERFVKLSRDAEVEREIMLSEFPISDLDVKAKSLISESRTDYMDKQKIIEFVKKSGEPAGTLALDDFAPIALARCLPELSTQMIPKIMQETATRLKLQAWEIFEDAVHSIFHFCFSYTLKKFGKETLFEHEPEGAVLVQDPVNFAFIYECKTARDSYQMNSDHELRYCDYIQNKRPYVKYLFNSDLQYFVIVGPSFAGDIPQRREKIYQKTGVLTVFMPAQVLSELGRWACALPSDVKRLIDLTQIFKISENEVSVDSARAYMKRFEVETKSRY